MFGSYTGKLQVLVHSVTKTYEWLKSGEQGDEWIEANIDLKMNQNFIVSTCIFVIPYTCIKGFVNDVTVISRQPEVHPIASQWYTKTFQKRNPPD